MKTPPSHLLPVPPNHVYIGVDDGSINDTGCEGEISQWTDSTWEIEWRECRVVPGPSRKTGLHIAVPIGSRLHIQNSVPDGFTLYGEGPLKARPKDRSDDIARWSVSRTKWETDDHPSKIPGWTGSDSGTPYALRTGSDIAVANGLVPPAEEPAMDPDPRHERYSEEFRAIHSAKLLLDATLKQVGELKQEIEDLRTRNGWGEVDRLKSHLNAATSQALDFSNSLARARARNASLKKDLIAAQSGNRSLAEKNDTLEKALTAAQLELVPEVDRLKQEVNLLRHEISVTHRSYNESRRERDEAIREVSQLRDEMMSLRQSHSAARIDRDYARGQAAIFDAALGRKHNEVAALNARVKQRDAELDSFLAQVKERDQELARVRETLKRFRDTAAEVAAL